MPKIKPEIDIEEPEEEDDQFEDDNEEDNVRKPTNLKTAAQQRISAKKEVKRRFGIMPPESLRIVDTETKEVVGEGEFAVIQALTDILERLERIETKIGAVIN